MSAALFFYYTVQLRMGTGLNRKRSGPMEIKMCRGDIFSFSFDIKIDGTKTTEPMDDIYMTVKRTYLEQSYIFQKRLSDGSIVSDGSGTYTIQIEPEDTNNLTFGTYDFDIELVKLPSIKRTFNGKLILDKESTYATNEVV
jgi:hypothetical protein